MFGSVWSDLLVLHKYSVIISECQKVTFFDFFDFLNFFFDKLGGWPQRTTGKPALTRVPRAGALDQLNGATPLWSLVAMVACGNQCKPFSIVTPTRANSEGKLQG